MDALIAERVMGLKPTNPGFYSNDVYISRPHGENMGIVGIFKPSTDVSAAWEVVEKMFETYSKEITVEFGWKENPIYAWHCHMGLVDATAETAPLAVCRAALLAVMG